MAQPLAAAIEPTRGCTCQGASIQAATPSPLTSAPPCFSEHRRLTLRGISSAARDRGRSRVAPNLTRPAAGRVKGGRYPAPRAPAARARHHPTSRLGAPARAIPRESEVANSRKSDRGRRRLAIAVESGAPQADQEERHGDVRQVEGGGVQLRGYWPLLLDGRSLRPRWKPRVQAPDRGCTRSRVACGRGRVLLPSTHPPGRRSGNRGYSGTPRVSPLRCADRLSKRRF